MEDRPGEQWKTTQEAREIAAEQAKKPLDERMSDVRNKEDVVTMAREQEAMRWEAIAEKQLEAAQTMERATEEFGTHVANLEGALRKAREFR